MSKKRIFSILMLYEVQIPNRDICSNSEWEAKSGRCDFLMKFTSVCRVPLHLVHMFLFLYKSDDWRAKMSKRFSSCCCNLMPSTTNNQHWLIGSNERVPLDKHCDESERIKCYFSSFNDDKKLKECVML